MNTWPGGKRRALSPAEHDKWNATHYPGTRQLCSECDAATGQCEEDALYADEDDDGVQRGPLCPECYQKWLDEKHEEAP